MAIIGAIWLWGPFDQGSGLTDQGGVAEAELAIPEPAAAHLSAESETSPAARTEAEAVVADPPPEPLSEGAVISGAVQDEDAVAQVDAELRLLRVVHKQADWAEFPWVEVEPAQSPDAEYKFTQLERGKEYAVVASSGTRWVASRPTLAPACVELVFPERFTVQATVRNLAGRAVEGARLSLVPIDGPGPQLGAASSQSNAAGEAQLEVQAGRYGLAIHHASGQLVRKELIEITGPTKLGDLVLEAGGEILLHVRQAGDGWPMKDVRIRRKPAAQPRVFDDQAWQAAFAREEGPLASEFVYDPKVRAYRMTAVLPGKHEFVASFPEYSSRAFSVEVLPGEVTEETVILVPSSQLRIRVVDSNGEPVAGQKIGLSPTSSDLSFRDRAFETDAAGEVIKRGLLPRDYRVFHVFDDRRKFLMATTTVLPGDNELEVTSMLVDRVVIRVTREREPFPGATVSLSVMEAGDSPDVNQSWLGLAVPMLETDASGLIVLPSVPPGEYPYSIHREGGGTWAGRCVISHSDQMIEVDCPVRTLRGRVVPPEAGLRVGLVQYSGTIPPLPDHIYGWSRRWQLADSLDLQSRVMSPVTWVQGMQAITDEDGRFEFRELGAGEAHVMVTASENRASELVVLKIADEDPVEVMLPLESCANIRVDVVNMGSGINAKKEVGRNRKNVIGATLWKPGAEAPFASQDLADGSVYFGYLQPGELTVEIRYYDSEKQEKVVLQTFQVTVERGKTEVVRWDGASAR